MSSSKVTALALGAFLGSAEGCPARGRSERNGTMESEPMALSVLETADALRVGRTKIFNEIAAGRLRACKVGSRTIIRRADLVAYLDRLAEEAES